MPRATILLIVLAIALLGIALYLGARTSEPDTAACSMGEYAGNIESLPGFGEKPLVVNAWAAWCPFCVDELPDFAEAQKEFGDAVTIIAIDRAEACQTAQKFTDKLGISNDIVFLLDGRDSFYRSIGGFSMPETLFINAKGETVIHKRGPMPLQEIREKIQQVL